MPGLQAILSNEKRLKAQRFGTPRFKISFKINRRSQWFAIDAGRDRHTADRLDEGQNSCFGFWTQKNQINIQNGKNLSRTGVNGNLFLSKESTDYLRWCINDAQNAVMHHIVIHTKAWLQDKN